MIDTQRCDDSPIGQHVANRERFGDDVCIWCLEGPPDYGYMPDKDDPEPVDLNIEGDPTRNGAFG